MIKKGDIFTAYIKGCGTENILAIKDYQEDELLCCVNKDGEIVLVGKDEIGEVLGNIDKLGQ